MIAHWFAHYPLEALPYEIGFLLLAVSMIYYSLVLKRMLAIIREKPVWLLPLAGALCLLISLVMHSVAFVVLLPQMDTLKSVADISRHSEFMLQWRTWSLACILIGGVLSLLGGGFYYRWTSR